MFDVSDLEGKAGLAMAVASLYFFYNTVIQSILRATSERVGKNQEKAFLLS